MGKSREENRRWRNIVRDHPICGFSDWLKLIPPWWKPKWRTLLEKDGHPFLVKQCRIWERILTVIRGWMSPWLTVLTVSLFLLYYRLETFAKSNIFWLGNKGDGLQFLFVYAPNGFVFLMSGKEVDHCIACFSAWGSMHKHYGFFYWIYNVAFGRTMLLNELKYVSLCFISTLLTSSLY